MSEKPCVLCNHTTDDALQFGEKLTFEDTTAHLYCLLLTSNLIQNGEDNEGLYGFLPKDIKSEIYRTKKLLCHYCHQKSATIGCCVKACRRSFHLPCALQNDCQVEFNDTFRSFCEDHRTIKKPKHIHKPTDLCTICYDEMGEFKLMHSIPLPFCNKNAWCHKTCLQQYAQTSGYFLKCPLCKDSDQFRGWIQERGVFIPDRDAKWEVDETGPNTFYGFEQHNERPSECIAKVCRCSRGRRYQVDIENHKYSLEYCHDCGSHAVHFGCLDTKEFRCEDCAVVPDRVPQSATAGNNRGTVRPTNSRNSSGNNRNSRRSQGVNGRRNRHSTSTCSSVVEINSDTDERFGKYLVTQKMIDKYKLRECSVRLTKLTAKDYPKTCISTDTEINIKARISAICSVSSEEEIRPMIRKNRKSATIFESETDSDIDVVRVKTANALKLNYITDTDSDQTSRKTDINENSRNLSTSNRMEKSKNPFESLMKSKLNSLRELRMSTSEEEMIRPTGTLIRKFFYTDSSDEQITGKENSKPAKSVAVVHPFSKLAATTTTSNTIIISSSSSSDEMVKMSMSASHRPHIFSTSDSDTSHKSTITQRYDYLKNISQKHDEQSMNSQMNDPSKTPTVGINTEPTTPNKRKHRSSIRSYFRDTSSEDDEPVEPKPKRKTPKKMRRTLKNFERPSNQASIMQFLQKFDPTT